MVYELVARRRGAGAGDGGDLLSMLLEAQDAETGEGMTDEQVRDEALTLLVAGQETTATALTWTFYLLSTHPEIARRLRGELADVLDDRTPTVEDLPRLPYLGMVIRESMRLYPPVWAFVRMALTDDDVGGYLIPRGAIVALVPYLTHRHPACWDNPEGFDPERFAPEEEARRPRYAYFPFGGGPRRCLGRDFALLELPLVVALALQRYRFDVVPGYAPLLAPKLTLHPRHGMPMLVREIRPAERPTRGEDLDGARERAVEEGGRGSRRPR
jgi:cytochrome P450